MRSATPTDPTPASTWLALSGRPIADDVLEWPPDLFALTDVLLDQSQAYRFVLSPPGDATWPPDRYPNWAQAVEGAGRDWGGWLDDLPGAALPDLLAKEWAIFREEVDVPLVCLVCEDLSQHDDVAEVIRSVGPTLVITPLLDGPQLESRWAARYASVLADDPGSAVATPTAGLHPVHGSGRCRWRPAPTAS